MNNTAKIYKGCSFNIYRLNARRRGIFSDLLINGSTVGRTNEFSKKRAKMLNYPYKLRVF